MRQQSIGRSHDPQQLESASQSNVGASCRANETSSADQVFDNTTADGSRTAYRMMPSHSLSRRPQMETLVESSSGSSITRHANRDEDFDETNYSDERPLSGRLSCRQQRQENGGGLGADHLVQGSQTATTAASTTRAIIKQAAPLDPNSVANFANASATSEASDVVVDAQAAAAAAAGSEEVATTTVTPMARGCNKLLPAASNRQQQEEPCMSVQGSVIGVGSSGAAIGKSSSLQQHDDDCNKLTDTEKSNRCCVGLETAPVHAANGSQGQPTGGHDAVPDAGVRSEKLSSTGSQASGPIERAPAPPRYWMYEQLVTSCLVTQQAVSQSPLDPSSNQYELQQRAAATFLGGIKRPNKRLVYFYDIKDDIDDEIEFLRKSLESKSYATSMIGQHDHYLDNIAKSQAAAARAKAATKLQQAQHKINIQRAEQDQHIKALALDTLTMVAGGGKSNSQLDRGSIGARGIDILGSPSERLSSVSQCGLINSGEQQQQQQQQRAQNIEITLRPHWASLPSHLNRLSMNMMRMYQSSLTSNLICGKQERAVLGQRGKFDRACCRADYYAYSRALQSFLSEQTDPLDSVVKFSAEPTLDNQPAAATPLNQSFDRQPQMESSSHRPANQPKTSTSDDNVGSHLAAIIEPLRLFPNIVTSVIDPNMMTNLLQQKQLRGQMSALQQDLLVSIENYVLAMARWEEKQTRRKEAQNRTFLNSSMSNLNRTTQALRRGSVVVLSKLKLFNHPESPRLQQQHPQSQDQRHQLGCRSVPRLSLTKAESLLDSGGLETNTEFRMPMSCDISDEVAININSSQESLSSQPDRDFVTRMRGQESFKGSDRAHQIKSCLLGQPMASTAAHSPSSSSANLPAYGRHSIAHFPARSYMLGAAMDTSNLQDTTCRSATDGSYPLARPGSYTPNMANKRSLPRPSMIGGWFTMHRNSDSRRSSHNTDNVTSDMRAGSIYSSRFSQTSSQLAEGCNRLLRLSSLRRRRSFSGPFEWLQKNEHKPPNDLMLTNSKHKQVAKRRLKKMKPQKSNSSDYHSLNNRRVYKLDARGFQTKLRGIFYVITNDPLATTTVAPISTVANYNQQLASLCLDRVLDSQPAAEERDTTLGGPSNEESCSNNESSFDMETTTSRSQSRETTGRSTAACSRNPTRRTFLIYFHWSQWMIQRRHYSLFIFSPQSRIRRFCLAVTRRKEFDYFVLFFISMNCVTLAMERPKIPPWSKEREFLTVANYYFTFMFTLEMALKVIAKGLYYGKDAYLSDSWNIMDGALVGFSLFDLLLSIVADRSPRIFAILRVFRLLRSLRPLRVINRLMGLKLVVQTLLLSLRPIGNIVLICCTFFIIFGILGVQLFKGTFYYCDGPDPLEIMRTVRTREDCLVDPRNRWINRKYNFDNLGQALMALFVLSSKDGWVNIMYTGLDAVGVDMQPRENYNEWRLLYFISFLLLVAFFVLNMFVGVVVENFHRCRKEQEMEEKARRAEKRQRKLDKRRRKLREPPYYSNYGKFRLLLHKWVTGGYFDLLIAAVIGFNVVFMSLEHYQMPEELIHLLKVSNYVFTVAFILEAAIKSIALGMRRYLKDRWNQLDVMIVAMSIVGIIFEEMDSFTLPINPTLLRVLRVMRIARVLKLLKMAKGIRALLDTVMQALPQVGNLGLLFFLLFFIFAALGVELFGRLECNDEYPCSGLMDQHAHFQNFGLAFLTLFRVATGDNWNGIMKDTLRDKCDPSSNCLKNCCVSQIIAPLYFVVFVLLAQFVLVNVVVAVLMKHLEESHHEMEIDEEYELDKQLAEELEAKKRALIEARERQSLYWV